MAGRRVGALVKAGTWVAAAGVVLTTVVFAGGGGDTYTSPPAAAAEPAVGVTGAACTVKVPGLDAAQTDVARRGVAAADRAGVGDAGAVIVIATGIVESGLRNLNHGDRDSVGWLQQRPSQGWVNARDVDMAADDFFTDMTRRVPAWRDMPAGVVAQAVQRSAHPTRYSTQVGRAASIVAALTGCRTASPAAPAGGKAAAMLAWAQTQVGKPYRLGANGPDAWDCSSFSRAALARAGATDVPRTAQAQRDWCADGNCTRIPEGQERPGDLAFWDSYLGPRVVGHVVLIRNPATRETVDARSATRGVINGTYPRATQKAILQFWRPNILTVGLDG